MLKLHSETKQSTLEKKNKREYEKNNNIKKKTEKNKINNSRRFTRSLSFCNDSKWVLAVN